MRRALPHNGHTDTLARVKVDSHALIQDWKADVFSKGKGSARPFLDENEDVLGLASCLDGMLPLS